MNIQRFRKILISLFTVLFIIGAAVLATAGTSRKSESRQKTEPLRVAQAQGTGAAGELSRITELTALEERDGMTVEIRGSDILHYTAFKLLKPLRLVLDFSGMSQGTITERIEVNQGSVSYIQPVYFSEANVLRVEIALSAATAYEIQKPAGNYLAIKFKPATDSAAQQAEKDSISLSLAQASTIDSCAKQLLGEKERISLDFQNVNIKDIFRIIADISGYNIVLAPGVQGSVNIRLADVPWNAALEIILKNNQLGRECDGNIVRIASEAILAASREVGLLVTEMIRINYADLKEIKATLSGMKSDRGSINMNDRTSILIITDIRENIDDMKNAIKALDLPTPQVTIAARMVQVSSSSVDELGFSWGIAHQSEHSKENFPAFFAITGETNKSVDPDIIALPGFNVDLPIQGTPAGQLGVSFANLMGNTVLNVQLQALESRNLARTIANPKITTLDNRKATISSGEKIPFQTFSNTDGAGIEFLDAEVSLTVTPHITPDNRIHMKIAALQNSIVLNQLGGFASVNTSEIFTEVLVNDGETTVLGGLYTDTIRDGADSVPFLKDIPLLGYLFSNSIESRTLDELLIFITPTIVRNLDL